ncbi:PREDICTED: uncharacterized protein LOC109481658 [Branchiostoma belcheri]|uniref:Uncharacterized protein LOC109481658 n=1 Tax=Branchiostoma belcheri TaxID=7741 RepID=A0A6P4ZEY2_BRABE|nr:PREDICTED: uncharacterized protein LOC109481658 [Branchiostoma belcheri]
MRNMGWALLLLLAALISTAAGDISKAEAEDDGLTEELSDVGELKEQSRRIFGQGGFLGTGIGAGGGRGGNVQSAAQGARGNTVYHVFAQAKNYAQAKQHCTSIGGSLANVKTRSLHDFVLGLIRKVDFNRDYWFGLNEKTVAKTWTWSDGSPIKGCDFTNWAPGQPDNFLWGQDCGQMWKAAGYKWDDDNCAHQKYFICQIAAWLRRDPSWVVDSAGTPWKNGGKTYDAAKALDGDTTTFWNPINTRRNFNNWYIVLDLKAPHTLSQIAVQSFGDTTHDVKAFKLQKSQSGSPYNWEDVKSVGTVQQGNKRQEFGGFQGTARYWRFVVTQTHSGWQPYLRELDLFGSRAGKTNIVLFFIMFKYYRGGFSGGGSAGGGFSAGGFSAGGSGGGGFSAGGLSGAGAAAWLQRDASWVVDSAGRPYKNGGKTYDAAKALDGDTTTYWNPQDLARHFNNWYIVLDLKAPHTLSQIAVQSLGDTTHDVKAFKLQKSQSGSPYNWEDVKSVGNVQVGTNKRQEFGGFQGTARYWRFVVTQTPAGWQPWLKELDFYGVRAGITSGNPTGSSWKQIPGSLSAVYVSSASNQVWGVNSGDQVFRRSGIGAAGTGGGSGAGDGY